MKILYHHRTQADDAQGIHIYEMIKAFRGLGHHVDIVSLVELDEKREKKIKGKWWERLAFSVPRFVYELMELAYNIYGYRRLSKQIRKNRPDLIYERYALNTFCGIWASRRFGIPIVLEVNLPLYYERSKFGKLAFKRLARFSERWICSNSSWTVTVSEAMKEFLIREGVPGDKMVVMHNGIDPEKFHPHISGEAVRRKYGLDGKSVVGFIGWFRKWHGVEMLLEVMHEANLAKHGIRLLLIGDGPAFPDLHNYVEKHGLQSAVVFTGPVSRQEVPAHIAAMDIAVLPASNAFGCPMKIFEYMAMGKSTVAPDQAAIREILEDRVTGFLFEEGNKEGLKAALLDLVNNREKREKTGQNAYQRIFQRGFLWSANARRTLALVFGDELVSTQEHR